jgi:hypothetical protein
LYALARIDGGEMVSSKTHAEGKHGVFGTVAEVVVVGDTCTVVARMCMCQRVSSVKPMADPRSDAHEELFMRHAVIFESLQ